MSRVVPNWRPVIHLGASSTLPYVFDAHGSARAGPAVPRATHGGRRALRRSAVVRLARGSRSGRCATAEVRKVCILQAAVLGSVNRIRDEPQFAAHQIPGPEKLLDELIVDAPPNQPTAVSLLGRTLVPGDLADPKLLALFDRVALRDLDAYERAQRYARQLLTDRRSRVGLGFNVVQLADRIAMLER